MKSILLLSILLTGCFSFNFDQSIEYKVEPELAEYVNAFYSEAEERNIYVPNDNLMVLFTDYVDGLAINANEGYQIIVKVDRPDYEWILNNWGKEAVENLIFHELGHALLNRDHNVSEEFIMAPGHPLKSYVGDPEKREYLLDELFGL